MDSSAHPALEGLSPAAAQVAEYLIRNSELGLDGDPQRELPELAEALGQEPAACRAASLELKARGWIQEDAQLINSDWRIAPRPAMFQALDHVWMGHDVARDAVDLLQHLRANADSGMTLPATAQSLGWLPRRINPALEYLSELEAADLGPYAHPYLANWLSENGSTSAFMQSMGV